MKINKVKKKLKEKYGDRFQIQDKGQYYYLTGQAETWKEAVEAGLLCAEKGGQKHLVSDVKVDGMTSPAPIEPVVKDDSLEGLTPDVLIIGGGVVGCSIARELSKNQLDILLIEKEYDVALHASSRNDGMVHPGIDIKPGLLKKKMNNWGNSLYDQLCLDLGVEFNRSGQYLCFKKKWLTPLLHVATMYFNSHVAGKAKVVGYKKLKEAEPYSSDEAKCAIYFDGAGMVCPYGLTIAMAENAVENGVRLSLDTIAISMETEKIGNNQNHITSVLTNRGRIYPKVVINAAGVFTEDVATMAKDRFFSIHPRKGTNAILDKKTRKNIRTIYSLMGTNSKANHTKGGGLVGTIDGNVLVGPDAVETYEKENFATHRESIEQSFAKHWHAGKWLSTQDIITYFTGIRAATYEEDFIIEGGRFTDNIIHAAGIQSPGLTAAPAIGLEIERLTKEYLKTQMEVKDKTTFNPKRKPIIKVKELEDEKRDQLIKENHDYGQILCRCEEISKGEIIDAMHRPVPCYTVDGIKRRVRPGMGRCQGGFCGQQVIKLIAQEKDLSLDKVRKSYPGSEIMLGEKGGRHEQL